MDLECEYARDLGKGSVIEMLSELKKKQDVPNLMTVSPNIGFIWRCWPRRRWSRSPTRPTASGYTTRPTTQSQTGDNCSKTWLTLSELTVIQFRLDGEGSENLSKRFCDASHVTGGGGKKYLGCEWEREYGVSKEKFRIYKRLIFLLFRFSSFLYSSDSSQESAYVCAYVSHIYLTER